jgi:ferric-dicitrate binding protein FerR (iron transport regulator)
MLGNTRMTLPASLAKQRRGARGQSLGILALAGVAACVWFLPWSDTATAVDHAGRVVPITLQSPVTPAVPTANCRD